MMRWSHLESASPLHVLARVGAGHVVEESVRAEGRLLQLGARHQLEENSAKENRRKREEQHYSGRVGQSRLLQAVQLDGHLWHLAD